MNKFTLLLLAVFCALGASATDYVGTTVVQTEVMDFPSEGTVLQINQNANGTYNAVISVNFEFQGYPIEIDDMTFENMAGTVGGDGYTTVNCTKQLSMLEMSGLSDMIPDWLMQYVGSALDRTIPVVFNARFNGVYASATINFDLNLSISVPFIGIDYSIINTPVLVTFEGQSQGGEEPPVGKKGDVDGNGTVDIDDVNIPINILLDYDSADRYDGRALVTDDNVVDIDDVNALINILLQQ